MAHLTLVEAAVKVGFSVELILYLTKKCPKHGEDRKLPFIKTKEGILIDETELIKYQRYLNETWPVPKDEKRPPMRTAIATDVKAECHFECAICGRGDHGEVAHIHAVADCARNGPDNLIFLCPNHHTAYDYGFRRANNVTLEVVSAAKEWKREARRRMLRYEANAAKAMFGLIRQINKIAEKLKTADNPDLREVGVTEIKSLLAQVTTASNAAAENAKKDIDFTNVEIELTKIAPTIAALAGGGANAKSEYDVRQTAADVVAASSKVIIDLGEVDCPHCAGAGSRGIGGSLCAFCGGSCFVATEVAKDYDADDIDEVECPRCGGRCQTGWVGDLCAYCKGDGVVTEEEAEGYAPDEMDEVECPHCGGSGQLGLAGTMCSVCKGSCFINREAAEDYKSEDVDEVSCPRCGGKGQTGWRGSFCAYCKGDGFVTNEQFEEYDPDDLDEVDCPRCGGSGQIGWAGSSCAFCKGECFVSRDAHAEYDPDELDEETCPRCGGSGQTGLVGDTCKLCKGDCVVSHAMADAYRQQYG